MGRRAATGRGGSEASTWAEVLKDNDDFTCCSHLFQEAVASWIDSPTTGAAVWTLTG